MTIHEDAPADILHKDYIPPTSAPPTDVVCAKNWKMQLSLLFWADYGYSHNCQALPFDQPKHGSSAQLSDAG